MWRVNKAYSSSPRRVVAWDWSLHPGMFGTEIARTPVLCKWHRRVHAEAKIKDARHQYGRAPLDLQGSVPRILNAFALGDRQGASELLPLLHEELRRLDLPGCEVRWHKWLRGWV